jgi:D-alanyl-D-alanine endopeptidase (penicillin-binding protein 7)
MAFPLVVSSARADTGAKGPRLTAKAALAFHHASGKALYSRDPQAVRSIASLTKIVAAMVFRRRNLALDEGTMITRADHRVALGGARTRIQLRWTYRNRDLLRAALMASDNRAISALGRAVGLDARALVREMNRFARRHRLSKTHFDGPVGIDHGNRSTAWEVAQLMRLASKDEVLSRIMSTRYHLVRPMRGRLNIRYGSTNRLLGQIRGVRFVGAKTGYNSKAGYCFAATARVRGLGLTTIVVLGSRGKHARMADARSLLSWLVRRGQRALTVAQNGNSSS